MSVRRGYTIVELLVTLALTAVVATALASTLLTHLRMARIVSGRAACADALRLTSHVLPAELRLSRPDTDLHGVGSDSVAARLARLSGTVCGQRSGQLLVRATGMREPDSRKDSVLLASADGEQAAALTSATAAPGACPAEAGESVYLLATTPPLAGVGVAVVFESGTYYLRERAFRYRLGGEGRQPLTEELLAGAGTGFVFRTDSARASITFRLAFASYPPQGGLPPALAGFALLNAGSLP